jgi:HTH-type transcriptional regulator/antitoxin MqsA
MNPFICEVCGYGEARIVNRPFDTTYNQIPIHLDSVEVYECEDCGESTLTPEQAKEISNRIKSLARERLKLLAPDTIVRIRRRYNLSQEDLERLFGLGRKVVIRWERGKVLQSKTADVLLRLMDLNPNIIDEMRKIQA